MSLLLHHGLSESGDRRKCLPVARGGLSTRRAQNIPPSLPAFPPSPFLSFLPSILPCLQSSPLDEKLAAFMQWRKRCLG